MLESLALQAFTAGIISAASLPLGALAAWFWSARNIEDPKIATTNRTWLTEEDGGTRVRRESVIEPRAFFVHLTGPLIRRAVERNAKLEFDNVKALLEQGEDALGPRRDPAAVAPD